MPANKTTIVCTIGPASDSPEMLAAMIEAGMNGACLNFSHGDFSGHQEVIAKIRAAEKTTSKGSLLGAPGRKPAATCSFLPESIRNSKRGPSDNWRQFTGNWLKDRGVPGNLVL